MSKASFASDTLAWHSRSACVRRTEGADGDVFGDVDGDALGEEGGDALREADRDALAEAEDEVDEEDEDELEEVFFFGEPSTSVKAG